VDASAAQKQPVTKTCSQCGAILQSSVRVCSFCDSSLISETLGPANSESGGVSGNKVSDAAWRGELTQRLEAYRTKRRRSPANVGQSQLPFEAPTPIHAPVSAGIGSAQPAVALADASAAPEEDFSFTIAIGRTANRREDDARMVIDVSLPLDAKPASSEQASHVKQEPGLYPVASIEERRIAALADAACLLFAYGAFLALFGSVGGQFTLSKLSAAVCTATFALVYLQYFALFTIFGGTTPGMMLRGLQVVSFSGETPTPRQMLLRSAGYILSAGTFFMGFMWAMWDEDSLTWHDRMSRTYLCSAQTYADVESSSAAHSR
jgi:uncharacterized RDD family membrane protein YckC